MLKLYKFERYCGYGVVEGLFVSTDVQIEHLHNRKIHFGEILGKHSEVSICFRKDDFIVKSDDQDFIMKLIEVMDGNTTISGYNPFNYIYDEDEIDEDE